MNDAVTLLPNGSDGPLSGRRVLLADDARSDLKVYSLALARAGAEVTAVADGVAAYQEWERAKTLGRPYHAVVLDFGMPGMNGAAVTASLRAAGYEGPVAGVTAGVADAAGRLWRSTGCDFVVSKSEPLAGFVQRVADAIRRPAAPVSSG